MPQKQKPARASSPRSALVPIAAIEKRIYVIRGQKVMLDRDLAELYGVRTMALNQQVKRNANRFPTDFAFRLSKPEAESLISQNVISTRRSFSRVLPSAFTEQGVAMLSSVLKSERAAQVNVLIMRAFVHARGARGPKGPSQEARRIGEEIPNTRHRDQGDLRRLEEADRKST